MNLFMLLLAVLGLAATAAAVPTTSIDCPAPVAVRSISTDVISAGQTVRASVMPAMAAPHGHAAHIAPTSEEPQSVGGYFEGLFNVYVPRRVCMYEQQDLIWTHVISDGLIAISYFSIPFALIYFVRNRRDLAFHWMFLMFASFILLCGITHVFGVWSIWQPLYRLDGVMKAATAGVSLATAVALWPLMPKAIALPSPAQLRRVNDDLAAANQQLEAMRQELELRVNERTEALEHANVRLAESNRELVQLNRIKDDFLSTLSHELRTPLNAIFGWAQILEVDAARIGQPEMDMEEMRNQILEASGIIQRNARAQSQLVGDLLDVSRIISGKLRIDPQETDLDKVILDAVETVQAAAENKSITVTVGNELSGRTIIADGDRLQQVIWNLLSNAIKFTPEGGQVDLKVIDEGGRVRIEVRDSGAGIAPEFLPKLFNRFAQAETGATRRYGGLGLGLAIVRHLIELHGGTVEARSEGKDKGALFVVRLPVVATALPSEGAEEASALKAEKLRRPQRLAGVKVLVVDDEPDARRLVSVVCSDVGALPSTAASAGQAFTMIEQQRPDVLVCDIGMPDVSGYDMMRQLRAQEAQDPSLKPLRAIALTAYARAEDRRDAIAAGFDMHLTKPLDRDELLSAVYRLVYEGGPARE